MGLSRKTDRQINSRTLNTIMKFLNSILVALALCLAGTSTFAADDPKPSLGLISAVEAEKLIQRNKDAVPLDVRAEKDFSEGHLANAKNIDPRQPDAAEKFAKLDKSKTYVVHCTKGLKRTTEAIDTLKSLGFTHIVGIEGGINAWVKDGKPVVK